MLESPGYRATITSILKMNEVLFKSKTLVSDLLIKHFAVLISTGSSSMLQLIIENYPEHHEQLFNEMILNRSQNLIPIIKDKQNVTTKYVSQILSRNTENKLILIEKL